MAIENRLVESLAERLGGQAKAQTIYGPEMQQEGVKVLPVARVRYGFGGGGGAQGKENEGGGGGGGIEIRPVGYIELREGRSRFRRIADPTAAARLLVAAGLSSWLFLLGIRSLTR